MLVDYDRRVRRPPVLVLAVVLVLVACSAKPATETSGTTGATAVPPDIAARSQAVLEAVVNEGEPGCSAAVGRDGTVMWTGARGVADISTGAKITPDTVFDIASVSKQFTATAILLLAGAGKLALDDKLSTHVTGLPAWADTVTVSQLMHHTSGIPDYTGLLEAEGYQVSDRTTQAQALQALTTVTTLDFPPGTRFEYSNSNYMLLGEILQRVSGMPLPEFLKAEIFQPLDLAMVLEPGERIQAKPCPIRRTRRDTRCPTPHGSRSAMAPSRLRPANWCVGRTTTASAKWAGVSCSTRNLRGRWKPNRAAIATAPASPY